MKINAKLTPLITTQQLGDVDLASDTFLSRFTDAIPITEQVLALPGMQGSGQVLVLRRILVPSPIPVRPLFRHKKYGMVQTLRKAA